MRVVNGHELRDERLGGLLRRNVLVAVDSDDAGDRIFGSRESLALKNCAQRMNR